MTAFDRVSGKTLIIPVNVVFGMYRSLHTVGFLSGEE